MASTKKRHQTFSDADLKRKKHESTPSGTLKCDAKWDRVFREYLREKDCDNTEYWAYPDEELDDILSRFWFEVRSTNTDENGEHLHYFVTSLRTLRNALTRELVKHNRNIDLTSDPQYKKSQSAFKDACKELKPIGKGTIKSYPEIAHADLRKLYSSNTLNPKYSPQSLQDKVKFDIRFYFACRANENVDKFTKETFKLQVDPNSDYRYIVKQQDEVTKNHQNDTEFVSGVMPEMSGSPLCLVTSYMTYISKLHPRCDFLWQQCKKKDKIKDEDVWYKPLKIGPNPLAGFMSRISHDADLSRVYTNHSIRVTGTTFLGRCNFSAKQIMAVTGHRSVNSLAVYQKVSENEKLAMGLAMNNYLMSDVDITKQVQTPQMPCQIAPKVSTRPDSTLKQKNINRPSVSTASKASEITTNMEIVQYEPEDPILCDEFNQELDFDVESVLNDIEQNNFAISQIDTANNKATTVQCQTIKKSSPKIPIFQNCKIGSIGNFHLHIHKN